MSALTLKTDTQGVSSDVLEKVGNSSADIGFTESVVTEKVASDVFESRNENENNGVGCRPNESLIADADTSQEEIDALLLEENRGEPCLKYHSEKGRANVKKLHGLNTLASQQRRRQEILQSQKQRRDEVLDKIRKLEDSAYSDSETEDEMDFVQVVRETVGEDTNSSLEEIQEDGEAMETVSHPQSGRSKRKNRSKKKHSRTHRQSICTVMLSEWMLEKPEDFEDLWLGVVCPVGKRCIVVASGGKTKIFSRRDEYLGTYRSLLPGGGKYSYRNATSRNRGVTILDCIWSQESQTFYVLDLISWNSHSCVNCDTEYRQFFIHSKFSENEELLERSTINPFPYKPLPHFSASETSQIMCSPVRFPERVDGVMFFHKESFYLSEINPLCLWLLLTQVESTLTISVSPELLSRQTKVRNLGSREKQIQKRNQEMQVI